MPPILKRTENLVNIKIKMLWYSKLYYLYLFTFLEGLKYLDYLNLHGCKYVGDVSKILPVKETLEELDISLCPAITDISSLGQLK
jgi:hypothetical protein